MLRVERMVNPIRMNKIPCRSGRNIPKTPIIKKVQPKMDCAMRISSFGSISVS